MNCITISKTNRSGVRYILLDAIFGVADEIFVCSAVLYRRTRAPVHYRDPLSVEDLLGTLRRGRCFHAKRWKVSRCRPSRAAQLARRLARCALVGSLLGGRLPEEEGRGNKERRPRRPSPAPGRAAAARDAFAARNASVLCSPATLRAALSSEKREHKRERHRNG
jgi:hypothetical protein